jgi:DNA-binding NarL/FixJ family response regulator
MNFRNKILVIEDDQKLGKTIKNLLAIQGYDVCYTDNGAIGIQKAFEYNPDLILCDIKMNPIDGYQVYQVLKESSMIDQVPFIFITGSSDLKSIRFGLDLGADDYFVKPFDNTTLVHAIEKRLTKYRKLKEIGKREFRALFNLIPNSCFLFDGNTIFEANQTLIKLLGIQQDELTTYTFKDFFDSTSFRKLNELIIRCENGLLHSFSESVTVKPLTGTRLDGILHVAVYEKYPGYSLMVGLISLNEDKNDKNEVLISDVLNVLKKENIIITDSLGEKLTDVFKQHRVNYEKQESGFFSQRENQVLCLSMEGLPTKIIADKLSISDRTVEKHRAKLMEKTNSNNMIEVIIFALRNNLLKI